MIVKILWPVLKKIIPPPFGSDDEGLAYWREVILYAFLTAALVFGLVALFPALALAYREQLWSLLVFDISMYLLVIVLVVCRNWPYRLRAAGILLVVYAVGIWVTVNVGPLSGGPAWLFAVAVFTGLLLGLNAALFVVVLNAFALAIIGWLIFNGALAAGQPFFGSMTRAVTAGVNFLALNAAAAVAVSVLVHGLQATAKKEKEAKEIIKQEQSELIEAREDLKKEIDVRKQTEEALRVERDTLDRITRSVGAGLAVVSRDYRTLWANAVIKKMFGDVEGRRCFEVYNQRRDICIGCGVREVFEKGKEEVVHEQSGRDAQGNLVWSQIIATPIRDAKGNITAALELVIPITERKRAEEKRRALERQLEQARKMEAIATLAGGIAHQFNNLLSAISGNIELLKLDAPDTRTLEKYYAPMENSIQRMAQLTGQLLAYARGGKYHVNRLPLSDFVNETLPLIKHTLKPTITVELELPENVACVDIDVTQMQTVLSAILANASEAIEGHGCIRLACRNEQIDPAKAGPERELPPGHYVTLTVTDDGRGMDEQTLNRVFEPFFSTKFQGRGLGMASVYGIVKNHNGWIFVESEEGRGTSVKISLPAAKAQSLQSKRPSTNGTARRVARTILVVEDEDMVMDVTSSILKKIGYRVLAARSGEEALQFAASFDGEIDLALLDIVLPDMGGKDVYTRLMKLRPNLKVIVCSGYTFNGPAQEILNQGAHGFIQKPYTLAALTEKLTTLMPNTG